VASRVRKGTLTIRSQRSVDLGSARRKSVACSCERDNKPSLFLRSNEFVGQPSHYRLPKTGLHSKQSRRLLYPIGCQKNLEPMVKCFFFLLTGGNITNPGRTGGDNLSQWSSGMDPEVVAAEFNPTNPTRKLITQRSPETGEEIYRDRICCRQV
jgi:hypothetical protein